MNFDELLDKVNTYYQLYVNENCLHARNLLFDLIYKLLEMAIKAFYEDNINS